jgi:anti-sigma factor RsiW
MNSHDPATHQAAQPLLPWLLTGTLEGPELAMVQAHLQTCAQCQADLDLLRGVRAAAPPLDPAFDGEAALGRLLPRLDDQTPRGGALKRCGKAIAANDRSWLRWAAAVEFGVIAVLAFMLGWPTGQDGAYRALGAIPPRDGNLVVVFKPETPERELRRIVRSSGARVVDGPTVTDAYVLAVPAEQTTRALAALGREPAVTLVEPLDSMDG